jgi:2-C-methyl-D-erythritol 4-phosphate cytidylyltransferase/2-C-methyl-D-erythritol 2,4-cyclodiphosphate synthase
MPTRHDCIAIIVAAGQGVRAGDGLPKQYRLLHGKPVLRWAVEAASAHPDISAVQVVIAAEHASLYADAVTGLDLLPPVTGGNTRQSSVLHALQALEVFHPQSVLIHDAARPLVSAEIMTAVCTALRQHDAAIPALPVADTLKQVTQGRISRTLPREGVYSAQTPQGFRYRAILDAHRAAAGKDFTDDAAIAEQAGLSVATVEGSRMNLKLTTQEDFVTAERLLACRSVPRTGSGFDVHRFCAGDRLWLCGVEIAHEQGLEGHSDADVGLHALTDAILGAAALGDIGQLFPPTDPKWKGVSSHVFLAHAATLVRNRGGEIGNVDVTIICERPKVSPHRDAMARRIATILDIDHTRVSVKATTTEGLGFTGRREGIAAQATATVILP